jgi:hypothetical protein
MFGLQMRYFRLPPFHLAKLEDKTAPICPGWVSKMLVSHYHQLFDASYGGLDQRLLKPLGNILRTEHQDGQTLGGGVARPTSLRTVIVLVGEFTKPPAVLVCFQVVWCHGRKPWLRMWLEAVVSERKTAAAQCTGQRRVVRLQGKSPMCELTLCRVPCAAKSPPPPKKKQWLWFSPPPSDQDCCRDGHPSMQASNGY